ncbi:MAG: cysteine hydrolase [Chloroflexota bacterium]
MLITNQTALLVVDLQVDFIDPQGRYPVATHHIEPMLAATNRLIAAAPSHGTQVIYIGNEYSPRDLANLFRNHSAIKGSDGSQLDSRVSRINNHYFSKDQSNAFTNPKLDLFLREHNVKQLVLTGVYASACVRGTALAGLKHGYQVSVVSDAVADASDQRRNAALNGLQRKGVAVLTNAQLLS